MATFTITLEDLTVQTGTCSFETVKESLTSYLLRMENSDFRFRTFEFSIGDVTVFIELHEHNHPNGEVRIYIREGRNNFRLAKFSTNLYDFAHNMDTYAVWD